MRAIKCPNCGGELRVRVQGNAPIRFDDRDVQFHASFNVDDLDIVVYCGSCEKSADELNLYPYWTSETMIGYIETGDEP